MNLKDNFLLIVEEAKSSGVMPEGGPKKEPSGSLVARKNAIPSSKETGMFSSALLPAILRKLERMLTSIKVALFIKEFDDDAARRPERLHDCCLDLSCDRRASVSIARQSINVSREEG